MNEESISLSSRFSYVFDTFINEFRFEQKKRREKSPFCKKRI